MGMPGDDLGPPCLIKAAVLAPYLGEHGLWWAHAQQETLAFGVAFEVPEGCF